MLNDRLTQPTPARELPAHLTREVDARACESAIWIALVHADRAGLAQLTDDLGLLHLAAGDCRRRIEAQAGG